MSRDETPMKAEVRSSNSLDVTPEESGTILRYTDFSKDFKNSDNRQFQY